MLAIGGLAAAATEQDDDDVVLFGLGCRRQAIRVSPRDRQLAPQLDFPVLTLKLRFLLRTVPPRAYTAMALASGKIFGYFTPY